MISARAPLLAFIFLTSACSGYTGDPPLPPRAPSEAPAAKAAEKAAETSQTPAPPIWYERYDLGAVVVEIDAGVGKANGAASLQMDRMIYKNPGLQAYERRLGVLRAEREQLLRENAHLRAQAELEASTASRAREELGELAAWLTQLSAEQAEVVSQTQVIVEEHGALLARLEQVSSDTLAQVTP